MGAIGNLFRMISEWRRMPEVRIDLRCRDCEGNDPFYEQAVRAFHRDATAPHPRFPLLARYEHGFCLYHLTTGAGDYGRAIESSGRRNRNKALRLGYRFGPLDFNRHLDDITAIRHSTPVRQGKRLPEALVKEPVPAINNPPSHSTLHDYPHFGVFRDDRVHAYAACLVAGELASIESIYGHADHLADGIVPLLVTGMAEHLVAHYPQARYFAYGSYFGATGSMRRFKRKFRFLPHRVRWILGD